MEAITAIISSTEIFPHIFPNFEIFLRNREGHCRCFANLRLFYIIVKSKNSIAYADDLQANREKDNEKNFSENHKEFLSVDTEETEAGNDGYVSWSCLKSVGEKF
jgi:hypothetical protein